MARPHLFEGLGNCYVGRGVGLSGLVGVSHRLSRSLPAESTRNLRAKRERIEGLEEHSLHAKVSESPLVSALNLGGEQQDGNACGGGIFAQFSKSRGTIHS